MRDRWALRTLGFMFVLSCSLARAQDLTVAEGPILLHSNIDLEWGGHTFSYLIQGQTSLFWTARKCPLKDEAPTALIGQYPLPGNGLQPSVQALPFKLDRLKYINQPQMVRTPDGFLHAFIGLTFSSDNPNIAPGKIRYFRSDKPEDVSSFTDRTELLPGSPFGMFHLRMNVGLSQDGARMALVVLAISEDGSVPFNTPVIFLGQRQGLDFVFREPVAYAEPMGLFYPQVACTEDGIVIVGEVWDNAKRATTRLLHLDWTGKLIHREDFPVDQDGQFFSLDMRPVDPKAWDRLLLYVSKVPEDKTACAHEFWEYRPKDQSLSLLKSLPVIYQESNPGKCVQGPGEILWFVNNPCQGQLHAWPGILKAESPLHHPLPKTDPLSLGFQGTGYLFLPNPLQGSILSPPEAFMAADCPHADKDPKAYGPSSLLMWRLKWH